MLRVEIMVISLALPQLLTQEDTFFLDCLFSAKVEISLKKGFEGELGGRSLACTFSH